MPDVRFDDIMTVYPNGKKEFSIPIDRQYIYVCESNSIEPISYTTTEPCICGLEVIENDIKIKISGNVPKKIVIKLTGIRKGFANRRFEEFTYEQMQANNLFWQQWRNK